MISVPVICIVGKSKAGKTTVLEHLVPEVQRRGYTVAVIKHCHEGVDLGGGQKDSDRLLKAGTSTVVLSSPGLVAQLWSKPTDPPLAEVARLFADQCDVIFAEGFHSEANHPKIEVHRSALGPDLLCDPASLVSVVSDGHVDTSLPCFGLRDTAALADWIEKMFLRPRQREKYFRTSRGGDLTLTVDGERVALAPFVQTVIERVLLAMVSSLKGVDNPKRVHIDLRLHNDEPLSEPKT